MSLEDQFKAAAAKLQDKGEAFGNTLSNEQKLKIYSLYKQGLIGDVNTERPGILDLKGKAKWDAWNEQKGKPQEEAQQEYIELIESLVQ